MLTLYGYGGMLDMWREDCTSRRVGNIWKWYLRRGCCCCCRCSWSLFKFYGAISWNKPHVKSWPFLYRKWYQVLSETPIRRDFTTLFLLLVPKLFKQRNDQKVFSFLSLEVSRFRKETFQFRILRIRVNKNKYWLSVEKLLLTKNTTTKCISITLSKKSRGLLMHSIFFFFTWYLSAFFRSNAKKTLFFTNNETLINVYLPDGGNCWGGNVYWNCPCMLA